MATRKSKSATQAAAETVAAQAVPETVQVQAPANAEAPQQGQVQVNVDFLRTTRVHHVMVVC